MDSVQLGLIKVVSLSEPHRITKTSQQITLGVLKSSLIIINFVRTFLKQLCPNIHLTPVIENWYTCCSWTMNNR